VLLIWDSLDTSTTDTAALIAALQAAGMNVTLSTTSETAYDGTNPSPAGFDAVVHLNGTTYDAGMPAAGQQALVDYVNAGGGFISSEWNAYEVDEELSMSLLAPLTLIRRTGSFDGGVTTLSDAPGASGHPVLANVPSTFTFSGICNEGPERFPGVSTVLMLDQYGNAAVVVQQVGAGRAVSFHHSGSYPLTIAYPYHTLADPNIQQLYIDGIRWAVQ
jgi:large repetitive protein